MIHLDDMISLEAFCKEAVLHDIPDNLILAFRLDYLAIFPNPKDRTLRFWMIFLEEWAHIIRDKFSMELLKEFDSEQKH